MYPAPSNCGPQPESYVIDPRIGRTNGAWPLWIAWAAYANIDPAVDPILKQAAQMQSQLTELSSRLLEGLGLHREQVAEAVAQLERHPVRGKQLQQVRRLVSRRLPESPSRKRGSLQPPQLPRGLRV